MVNYSIISFVNGLIAASGLVLAILMHLAFMPIVKYGGEFSPITEVQILTVSWLGFMATAIALAYEVYRWIRARRST